MSRPLAEEIAALRSEVRQLEVRMELLEAADDPGEDIERMMKAIGTTYQALRSLQMAHQLLFAGEEADFRCTNSHEAIRLYRLHGDQAGPKLLAEKKTDIAHAIVREWFRAGRHDGATLRALLAFPDGAVRNRLLRDSPFMTGGSVTEEDSYVWNEVVLPILYANERSKLNRKWIATQARNHFPDAFRAMMADVEMNRRIFQSRDTRYDSESLVAFVARFADTLPDEDFDLLIERTRDQGFGRKIDTLRALWIRTDLSEERRARLHEFNPQLHCTPRLLAGNGLLTPAQAEALDESDPRYIVARDR